MSDLPERLENAARACLALGYGSELSGLFREAANALAEDCVDCDHGVRGGHICQSCGGGGRVPVADLLVATAAHVKELKADLAAANAQVLDLVARMTFIKGGDIPRTIEAARAALVLRCRDLEAELAALRDWLDNSTTYYDTAEADRFIDVQPVLAAVSKRIWYHATDDQASYPFSAVAGRAIKEVK